MERPDEWTDCVTIGDRFQSLRSAANLTVDETSAALGLDVAEYQSIEDGSDEHGLDRWVAVVVRVAVILQVPLASFTATEQAGDSVGGRVRRQRDMAKMTVEAMLQEADGDVTREEYAKLEAGSPLERFYPIFIAFCDATKSALPSLLMS